MRTLDELKHNWEGFAQTDALWAILTDPEKRGNRWQAEEFFATGEHEVATVLGRLRDVGLEADTRLAALDFGCGVGRLTQALAARFAECWGIDISPTMVEQARRFNRFPDTCRYLVNDSTRLSAFEEGRFGFIYSSIVLQHIEPAYVREYLAEFVRVLRPGGFLVFQLPDRLIPPPAPRPSPLARLRARLRLGTRLRALAGRPPAPPRPAPGFQMDMHCLAEAGVREIVGAAGGRVVDVALTNSTLPDFNGRLRYLDAEPREGYVSKQYCVSK